MIITIQIGIESQLEPQNRSRLMILNRRTINGTRNSQNFERLHRSVLCAGEVSFFEIRRKCNKFLSPTFFRFRYKNTLAISHNLTSGDGRGNGNPCAGLGYCLSATSNQQFQSDWKQASSISLEAEHRASTPIKLFPLSCLVI